MKALYAGSFDPYTIGHDSIARRVLPLVEKLVIAVGYNEKKPGMISVADRVEYIRQVYAGNPKVEVRSYNNLTTDFAREIGADALVRGVRSVADFEAERNLADTNREISGLETLLVTALPEHSFVSSSMVRELIHFGADASRFLPLPLSVLKIK